MKTSILGAVALLASVTVASASTCPADVDQYVSGAIACFEPGAGDLGPGGNPPTIGLSDPFGDGADWDWVNKIDGTDTSGVFGSFTVELTFDEDPSGNQGFTSDSTSGTWAVISSWPTDQRVAFAFKGSNDYILYEMDTSGSLLGTWDTTGLFTGQNNNVAALSNFSVYVSDLDPSTPPVVPAPATLWLLGGALLTGAAVRRRRRPLS